MLQTSNTREVCEQLAATEAERIIVARELGTSAGLGASAVAISGLDDEFRGYVEGAVPIAGGGHKYNAGREVLQADENKYCSEPVDTLVHPEKYKGMSTWSVLSIQQ